MLKSAASKLQLESNEFVVTNAAVSSVDGHIKFPNSSTAGSEGFAIDSCDRDSGNCVEVPMYNLQSYVSKFVKGTGPIDVLQIDVEGFDFDVLSGAGPVLDRTNYLEFEYSDRGTWPSHGVQDAVKLLDEKGFTCYWAGKGKLWRITNCYFDVFDSWHSWSNVACVRRTFTKLAEKMEGRFLSTIDDGLFADEYEKWDGKLTKREGLECDTRAQQIMQKWGSTFGEAISNEIKYGHCIKGQSR